jgi:hypothetical protein
MLRLTAIRPRDLDLAATWVSYLTSLGKEGPSLAQIATGVRDQVQDQAAASDPRAGAVVSTTSGRIAPARLC